MDTAEYNLWVPPLITGEDDLQDKRTPGPYYAPLKANFEQNYSVDMVGVRYLSYTPENMKLVVNMPQKYKVVKFKDTRVRNAVLTGTRNNLWKQLQDIGNTFDDGPYFMGSRDNKVVIQNENINSPIQKVYTYAGGSGNLLTFSINKQKTKKGADTAKVTEIDPETGELKTTYFQVVKSDSVNIDALAIWPNERTHARSDRNPYHEDQQHRTSGYGKDIDESSLPALPKNMSEEEFDAYVQRMDDSINQPAQGGATGKYKNDLQKGQFVAPKDAPMYKAEKDFESIDAAMAEIAEDPDITQAEFTEYLNNVLMARFNKLKTYNGDSGLPEDFSETVKSFNSLGVLVIKRTFKVKYVNQKPTNWSHGFQEDESLFSSPGLSNQQFNERWLKGLSYFTTASEIQELSKNGDNTYNFIKYVTKEVPINGARILACYNPDNFNIQMANDIKEAVGDYVKAKALMIGDPTLESSMNIQIQNVSSLYTGVWYAKKVKHKFEPGSGYTCEVEFKLRAPIQKILKVESNLYTRKWLETASEKAKAALKSGKAYQIEELRAALEELAKKYPGYSHLFVTDGNNVEYYQTDEGFSPNMQEGKSPSVNQEVVNKAK